MAGFVVVGVVVLGGWLNGWMGMSLLQRQFGIANCPLIKFPPWEGGLGGIRACRANPEGVAPIRPSSKIPSLSPLGKGGSQLP